ncbi:hypothetical protein [Pedobacter sp. ASV28]|uniref:hypothetical protein n=1 Tax=Pedobacter sp. ASV28 TaxID=2795123 RepID=UPI0018EAA511|nr:hypothetical protein [Pedobacter sp. ASV28]
MSHSETSHLEQLVTRHVLTKVDHARFNENNYLTAQERIRNERIKLESQLSELLCSSQDDMIIKRKIRHGHIRLIQLSNQVYDAIKKASRDEQYLLAKMALENINELMQHAEALAANYIDPDIPLSRYIVDDWGNELFADYAAVEQTLKKEEVDSSLIQSLSAFFSKLVEPTEEMFEKQFRYAEKLLRGLHKMIEREPREEWTFKLWHLMVYLNFNKKDILAYSFAKVKKMGQLNEPYLIVQEKLLTFLKDVRQIEENPTFMYLADRISLKAYTIEQLEEELSWLQQHRNNLLTEIANSDDNYFIVDLTVRKLNLWAQINVELGTIPYHPTNHVVKVMANYIRTLKPGPISYGSARKKLDPYDPTTVKGLHLWLSNQIEHLEKRYSEQLHYVHG